MKTFTIHVGCSSGPLFYVPEEYIGLYPADQIREWRFDYLTPAPHTMDDITALIEEQVLLNPCSTEEARRGFSRVVIITCVKNWNLEDMTGGCLRPDAEVVSRLPASISLAACERILAGADEYTFGPPTIVIGEDQDEAQSPEETEQESEGEIQ